MSASDVRPHWFRVAVTSLRTATTVAGLTLLLGLGALSVIAAPQQEQPEQLGLSARPLDQMMEHNRCSFTGFDRTVIPSKAVIRTPEGVTKVVSFYRGWAVFSGEAAGDLVAVCLGPEQSAATAAAAARH